MAVVKWDNSVVMIPNEETLIRKNVIEALPNMRISPKEVNY